MERYEEQGGRYVLYLDAARIAAMDVVALLIDAQGGRLITHGDPRSVRREFDALRVAQPPESTAGWLLLEGRPAIAALNRALRGKIDLHDLHLAYTRTCAQRLTRELIARLMQRRMT
jgi:hypothetical protein